MDRFAAIDTGSYEMSMKIFEISKRIGVREIDSVRHRLDLGSETYRTGRINFEHVREMIRILQEYKKIMDGYGVTSYQAYGTSAFRETDNIRVVIEQIREKTGIKIDVLSNSEQRFLGYKSVALKTDRFEGVIEKPSAILDIGGGSTQLSLFDQDTLVMTQNVKMGSLRERSLLERMNATPDRYGEIIGETLEAQLESFAKIYLRKQNYQNLIIIDDYVAPLMQRMNRSGMGEGFITLKDFKAFFRDLEAQGFEQTARVLQIPDENVSILFVCAALILSYARLLGARVFWTPGVALCDGIAYEYAEKKKYLKVQHDFDKDLIACAKNISAKYMGSKSRQELMRMVALRVFDGTKKQHGLGKRQRLLLELGAILNDCGKYISPTNLGQNGYNIIMSTEIIGLSHKERKIVANLVRFDHMPFAHYDANTEHYKGLEVSDYIIIAKLTAILRLAGGLDRTRHSKFTDVSVKQKDDELIITLDTAEDILLEKTLFGRRADFFEEIFGMKVSLRQKRRIG